MMNFGRSLDPFGLSATQVCIQKDEFCIKMMNFVFKLMNFGLSATQATLQSLLGMEAW